MVPNINPKNFFFLSILAKVPITPPIITFIPVHAGILIICQIVDRKDFTHAKLCVRKSFVHLKPSFQWSCLFADKHQPYDMAHIILAKFFFVYTLLFTLRSVSECKKYFCIWILHHQFFEDAYNWKIQR